ncbi:hypothetical protein [uncultured Dokdonia sp.]|uniref:hypothetical protein n=1 Tax=uncultured Dokdonia sp. TaxID=575653 RepID=UPI00260919CA|nr:hypothetical protein [uncultured Dokdonia sp.]
MKQQLLFLTLSVFMLCSCDSGIAISNDKAIEILRASFTEDCYDLMTQRTLTNWDTHRTTYAIMKELEGLGLITIQQKNVGYGINSVATEYRWKPTEQSETEFKKGGYVYLITSALIKDIIGISVNEEAKTASVRFSYEAVASPFYMLRKNKNSECKSVLKEATAHFVYYDSGWRLESQ